MANNSSWLTVTPLSGNSGTTIITISADSYTNYIERLAEIKAYNSTYGVTGTSLTARQEGVLSGIAFTNLEWITNISAGGGTASSANCSYIITGYYSDGYSVNVTNDCTITGTLVVPASTASTITSAGTLTLTATCGSLTAVSSVTVYQNSYANQYLTLKILTGGTITWYKPSSASPSTIQYKINNGDWQSFSNGQGKTFNNGDIVQLKGTGITGSYFLGNSQQAPYFNVYGNIMSLMYGDDYMSEDTLISSAFTNLFYCTHVIDASKLILPANILAPYCYASMFSGCTSLTSAPTLPAQTLAQSCYEDMFWGCTSLRSAPALPATTLAQGCYSGMFWGCTTLAYAPALPATTLANGCYWSMFGNCTSLRGTPSLPATTLAQSCYRDMFGNCTGLTSAPATLPVTTLADYCYTQMFSDCISLRSAPSLPATTLAQSCYSSMFYNCTSLTSAPVLSATTLVYGCYQYMFAYCSSLNHIECYATDISASDCTKNWVNGVASTGTFVKNANMSDWTTGTSGIPTNWVVEDFVPELTGITFSALTWTTDIPFTGGTATSANTSFYVIGTDSGGSTYDVTSSAIISGSLVVSATTTETREAVGTLSLTATYSGFTSSSSVTAYQAAYQGTPVSITTDRTYFNIGYTGSSSANTSFYVRFKPHTGGYGNTGPASSDKCNTYIMGRAYTAKSTQFSINCYYDSSNSGETKFNLRYYSGNYNYDDYFITSCSTEQIYEATLSTTGVSASGGGKSSATTFSNSFTWSPLYLLGGDTEYNGYSGVITFYEASIYEGSTLVHHYIPWEDSGHGCVKDTVTDSIIQAVDPTKVTANYS